MNNFTLSHVDHDVLGPEFVLGPIVNDDLVLAWLQVASVDIDLPLDIIENLGNLFGAQVVLLTKTLIYLYWQIH